MKHSVLQLLFLFVVVVLFTAGPHFVSCKNSVINTAKVNTTDPSKVVKTIEKESNDNQELFEIEMKQHVDPCFACIGNCKQKYADDKPKILGCAEQCDEDPACIASKKAHPGLEGMQYSGFSFSTNSKKSTSQSSEKMEYTYEKAKDKSQELGNGDNINLDLPSSGDSASQTDFMQHNFKTKPHSQQQKISDEQFDDLQCKACKEHCDTVRHHGSIHAFCLKSCHTCKT